MQKTRKYKYPKIEITKNKNKKNSKISKFKESKN